MPKHWTKAGYMLSNPTIPSPPMIPSPEPSSLSVGDEKSAGKTYSIGGCNRLRDDMVQQGRRSPARGGPRPSDEAEDYFAEIFFKAEPGQVADSFGLARKFPVQKSHRCDQRPKGPLIYKYGTSKAG